MQLFITNNYSIHNTTLEILDARVFYQCTKVLRYKQGDRVTIQNEHIRYTCSILWQTKHSIITQIDTTDYKPESHHAIHSNLIVAMVNKRDKMELIAQKCAELWVSTLGIWKSKRSVISIISDNKLQRLQLIMLEAAEQSWNRSIPTISLYTTIDELDKTSYYAYQYSELSFQQLSSIYTKQEKRSIIIGPEWWFDPSELDYFQHHSFQTFCLGNSILRTETAAILSARICSQ